MGVLGTELDAKDATKIVIAKVIDKEDCYEIIRVYGDNEDFDVICTAPLRIPAQFCKKAVNHQLQTFFNDLPVYTCKISHNSSVMTANNAFNVIFSTTELWDNKDKENKEMETNTNISVNMENLDEEEREQLLALIEKANTPQSKLWKPKEKEEYFSLNRYGEICPMRNHRNNEMEKSFAIGNCFRTREEAEFMAERLKVIQKLKEIANGFNPIKEKAPSYYCLHYRFREKKVGVSPCYSERIYFNDIYFATKDDAEAAIEAVGEENLIKYYFCI